MEPRNNKLDVPLSENKKQKKQKGKSGSAKRSWIFFFITLLLFIPLYLIDNAKAAEAFRYFYLLAFRIFPMLLIVFVFMVLINLFLKTKVLIKYMGKSSGFKGWLMAIVSGILSMGAIYLWFPILKELLSKGVKPGLVAAFLYNRGIKLPWLPLMTFYFGLKYVIILTFTMILASLLQGRIIDFFIGTHKP